MKEIRNNEIKETSINGRKIEGYSVVFDSLSQDLGGFKEIISRDAITNDTIDNSDILFLYNHDSSRGVLARSKYGNGSLNLKIDEKGLRFSFEVPNSSLGNEVLESIKRGDITACSFAFTVEEDEFTRNEDETIVRTIRKIKNLYDSSVVIHPAYEATSVQIDTRGLKEFIDNENKDKENITSMIKEERSKEDILKEIENLKNLLNETEKRSEDKEDIKEENQEEESEKEEKNCEKSEDEKREDSKVEEEENKEENTDEEKEEKEEDNNSKEEEKQDRNLETNLNKENRNNNFNIKNNHSTMKQKFSLLKSINDVVNNRELNTIAQNVTIEGRKAAELAGVTTNGQIVIPIETEKRFEDNPSGILASQNTEATTYGGEAVPTEMFDLMGALRDRMVISQLGARFLSLNGNVEIPIYSGANATWESEISSAKDGSGKFSTVKFSPKRLTVELPISKQFLIQTSASAEATLRQDLIDCIAEKLQKTMFGDGAGDNVTPAGLFNGVLEDANAFNYAEAVNMEELLETHNVYGEFKYVMHPTAKALLRTTNIDRGSGKFVFENNAVLGIDAYSTNSVVERGVILGNWNQFYVASFGALDLTIDPYTLANRGQVKLTINAYFDFKEVRPEAFVKRIIKK